MNLRQYAKGQECMIRLPGCSFDNEQTVLCHLRFPSTGMSTKERDVFGAWGCHHCHMIVDGQAPPPEGWTKEAVLIAFYEAVFRTQEQLIKDGMLRY